MSDLKDRLLEEKLIVILRGLAEEKLIATVDILKNMGMHFFELAIDNESELSMEKSLRNIEGLRKHYGDSIHIGAGTVINKLQVKRVAEIGGEYIISPNLNEEVVRATKEMGLVSIPGAATPSEIIRAYQAGADIVKVPGETHVSAMAEFQQEFLELYKKSDLNMPWNKLYRKALAGVFDTSLNLGEDLLFNLEYLSKCRRVAVLGEPLCWYVQDVGKTTLSSEKRQNRMELAERICRETENFYEKTWGTPCKDGSIFLRYMNEVMDECEKLPDDRTLAYREKLEILHGYAKDPLVKNRGSEVRFTYPDYLILWIFLKRDMVRTVYGLCVVRSLLVKGLHEIRRSRR